MQKNYFFSRFEFLWHKVGSETSYVEIESPQVSQQAQNGRRHPSKSGRGARNSRSARAHRSTAHPHEELSGDFFRNSKWNRQMHDSDGLTSSISSLGSYGSRDSDLDDSEDLVFEMKFVN